MDSNFWGVILIDSDLSNIDFCWFNFWGVDLSGVYLEGVNFS